VTTAFTVSSVGGNMSKTIDESRRQFLRSTIAGVAGVAGGQLSLKGADAAKLSNVPANAWGSGKNINPAIPNTRVAKITDPGMVLNAAPRFSVEGANKALDTPVVHASMDKMAVALAEPESGLATDAWATIFQLPQGKSEWHDVNVGLITNGANMEQCARIAIFQKLAIELNRLGVPGENMVLFDAGRASGRFMDYDTEYTHSILPEGFRIEKEPGGRADITLPEPDPEATWCVGDIAGGKIDLLINVPVCKGHDEMGFTMAMKLGYSMIRGRHNYDNEYDGRVARAKLHCAIHQSQQVVGGTPPRMQLVVLDALWTKRGGPFDGGPDHDTATLVMGTLSPVIDYWAKKYIRENPDLVGQPLPNHQEVIDEYMRQYGLNALDIETVDAAQA